MEKLKIGNFDTLKDFAGYSEYHYLPLLYRLCDKDYKVNDNDRHLLAFLYDDIVSLINNF